MNELELEELISAYVDGELSGDDQSRVERVLSESARGRQIHDEFVAMRASLQSLPREELDPGFTRRVLERVRLANEKQAAALGKSRNGQVTGSLAAALALPPAWREFKAGPAEPRRGAAWARHPLTWAVAVVATILLAMVWAPNHFGLRFGKDDVQETIGANPEGGNSQNPNSNTPENPPPVLVDNGAGPKEDEDQTPAPRTIVNDAVSPAGDEVPPRDVPPRIVNNSLPAPNDPPSPAATNNEPSPQIARNTPQEKSPAPAPESIESPLAEFAVNYAVRDWHVVRVMVSPQAMRSRALDEILEKEEVLFRVAGGRSEANRKDGGEASLPELDLLLVNAVPGQLDGVFGALKKRPADFRPLAVYTAPADRVLDWILTMAFPTAADPAPSPRNPSGPPLPLVSPDPLSSIFNLSTEAQKVFAWRAPPPDLKLLDQLFPIPEKIAAAAAGNGEEIKADQTVQVMFILFRGK